jgi:hypothetical protein
MGWVGRQEPRISLLILEAADRRSPIKQIVELQTGGADAFVY